VGKKPELDVDAILDKLDNIRPCTWIGLKNLMYIYVKRRNSIPLLCHQCWKVLLFFDEKEEFKNLVNILNKKGLINLNRFRIRVESKEYSFKFIPKREGGILMVIYVMGKSSGMEKFEKLKKI